VKNFKVIGMKNYNFVWITSTLQKTKENGHSGTPKKEYNL